MEILLPNIYKVYRDEGSGGWGYSYLVQRPTAGNILFARMAKTASIEDEYQALHALGGVQHIYITDFHFAGKNVGAVAAEFGADIYCSEIEVPKIKKRGITALSSFRFETHALEPDVTVIPTPGHTDGGVCYLLDLAEQTYLFTGDLLYFDTDHWVLGASKYTQLAESLARLAALEFDYLVGCGDENLGQPYIELTPSAKEAFFAQLAEDYS